MGGISLVTGGKGFSDREKNDFYPTPSASTRSLCESGLIDFKIDSILEPCAGKGHIVKILREYYPEANFKMIDKIKYDTNEEIEIIDFLEWEPKEEYEWVITNPPYNKKLLMPIVKKSLNIATKGVAMFLKITFLESVDRKKFFDEYKNLKYVLVFSNRQPMYKNGISTGASNAICYAWFIWHQNYYGDPMIKFVNNKDLINKDEY